MKKPTAKPDEDRPDFETALQRLEEIVERLDEGNLPLAESLSLFKEGTKLARLCRELLSDAEVQVKNALEDVDGDEAALEES